MTSIDPLAAGATQTDLVRLSRDLLRRAAAGAGHAPTVPALVGQLGLLSELLAASGSVLDAVRSELRRREDRGTVAVVTGPFHGEPAAAVATVDLWADRARTSMAAARDAIDTVHVAASGLAER